MAKLIIGENDLATAFPQLLSEWCYEKNNIDPHKVYYGSTKIVWWKCPQCKNIYDTQIRIRAGGSNCPYCSGQRVLSGFNDLKTWCIKNNMENLLEEWDYDKNDILPSEVTRGTRKKVWWKCSRCNKGWETSIVNRTKGKGCPECGNKKIWEVKYINLINKKGSLVDTDPKLLEEWDYDNNTIDPNMITSGSGEIVWWKCKECGTNWKAPIVNRKKGRGCPECGIKKIWKVRRKNLIENKGNLFQTNAELMEEWDYDKNSLNPSVLSSGSHQKAWWKCKECGNSWEASIAGRTRGNGCPLCGKDTGAITRHKNILNRRGSLQDLNPEILDEWDYSKNIDITPKDVTVGSPEKVWWKCNKCGNSWEATVASRSRGRGCPQCARETQSSFPEQAVYYYIKKMFPDAVNGDKEQISPYELDIYIPSIKTAIEYDGQAYHKREKDLRKNKLCISKGIFLYRIRENKLGEVKETDGVKCLYIKAGDLDGLANAINEIIFDLCGTNIKISIKDDSANILNQYITKKKESSIAINYPEIAAEWDYEKNKNVKPDMLSPGSDKIVWWICKNNHSYKASVCHRVDGKGCPYCSKRKLLVGFNDFATCYPKIAAEWDYSKNNGLTPREVIGGAKKIWWICPKGHSYEATMNSRTNRNSGCSICSNIKALKGFNDLSTTNPEIAAEWDYDKNNGLLPEAVVIGSNKRVWWICPKGHSYDMPIYERKNSGCPFCAGKRVLSGFNDLETRYPEIALEWDYKKNELTPSKVTPGSRKKFWWICKKNHSYLASIAERTGHGTNCPYCANRKVLVGFNDLATIYPELVLEWDYSKNVFSPTEVVFGTPRKAWWKCSVCGYSWKSSISTRTKNGYGCPECGRKKCVISRKNNKI